MLSTLVEITDRIVKKFLPTVIEEVRIEISSLVLKMLLGIVLSSTIIFSIFQVALYYLNWSEISQGESLYPFYIFGSAIIFSLISLYYLFKVQVVNKVVSVSVREDPVSLLIIFSQGFLTGFSSKAAPSMERNDAQD